jgi:hypothetical protein
MGIKVSVEGRPSGRVIDEACVNLQTSLTRGHLTGRINYRVIFHATDKTKLRHRITDSSLLILILQESSKIYNINIASIACFKPLSSMLECSWSQRLSILRRLNNTRRSLIDSFAKL